MKKYMILLSIVLLTAVAAYPQRGGGGGGRGSGGSGGWGQGGQQGQYGQGGQQGQQGQQGGMQSGNGQTERERARINSRQRQQLGECSKSADGLRKQARDMAKKSGGKNFNAGEARQQFSKLQEQVQTMNQEHEQLMQGMDAGQQEALQSRIRSMNRLQTQLKEQVRQMNSELEPADPDARRIREQARKMEKTMEELKKQYNTMASQSD
jgi:outer membrane murein-binding lipoprotein Lpp